MSAAEKFGFLTFTILTFFGIDGYYLRGRNVTKAAHVLSNENTVPSGFFQ